MMDTTGQPYQIGRLDVVRALMTVRHEWETAARGDNLTEIQGSVGYLLFDIARVLNLSHEEMRAALGDIFDDIVANFSLRQNKNN
jgi:hypothetical protein